jgi:cation transport regulator ChaC
MRQLSDDSTKLTIPLNTFSAGPSGWNAEYLLNLAHALSEIAPESRDDHVFELEHKVKAIIEKNEQADSKLDQI